MARCVSYIMPLPARPSRALLLADGADAGVTWLPLVYALGYAEEVPTLAPARTAAGLLRDFFSRFEAPGDLRT